MRYRHKIQTLILSILLLSGQAIAQHNEPLFNFKFNHQTNGNAKNLFIPENDKATHHEAIKFSQFDSSLVYPWQNEIVNVDFGLTLRHLSGVENKNSSRAQFYTTLPLLHASALFNTKLKGLSAGLVGNHFDSKKNQILDYRAQVSYEWRKGFGLQGGWQHQRFNLDKASDVGTDYESNGPYIDFYLDF